MATEDTQRPGLVGRIRYYLERDIWEQDLRLLARPRAFLIYQLRVIFIVARGFVQEKLKLRAMALTYITLFSIVPLLAVSLSLFKGFGGLAAVEQDLLPKALDYVTGESAVADDTTSDDPAVVKMREKKAEIRQQIIGYVAKVQGGAIGGIGIAFLLLSVVTLLGHIEKAFNDIWGVRRDRSFFQKLVYYLFVVIVGPVLIGLSLSLSASFQNDSFVRWFLELVPGGQRLFGVGVPIAFTCLAFFFLYLLMPNTSVRMRPALIGGVVGGLTWELAKFFYYVILVGSFKKFDAVFSSLAAVPLFILWIYFSWVIVLFGAAVAFANQNARTYRREERALSASQAFREILALRTVLLIAERFEAGRPAVGAAAISSDLNVPVRLVRDVVHGLVDRGLLVEVATEGKEPGYHPARPTESFTPYDVVRTLRQAAGIHLALSSDSVERYLEELVSRAEAAQEGEFAQFHFKRLVAETGAGALMPACAALSSPVPSSSS
ncbi:MAG: YihY family inner membrane protein [Planctomycetes bacterium]|nr:YihY family inner membrane protein [Planctomycetota bacterium]